VKNNQVVVSRESELHLQLKVADAFRLSEEALIVIGGRISIRDQAAGRLEAITPWTMKSWGETIQVAVMGVDGDVFVHVKSACRLSTTIVDWGKNADNLKRFGDWLTKTAPA
jgi:hypothetical protein